MAHELWKYCWCDECKERRVLEEAGVRHTKEIVDEINAKPTQYCGHNSHLYCSNCGKCIDCGHCQERGCGECVSSLGTYVDADHHRQEVAELKRQMCNLVVRWVLRGL
jgi:hypothetical protein